jgi:Rps23 Pro-64 3,4-dihydroxylase Tpa1-like proline 4-hydroxylase
MIFKVAIGEIIMKLHSVRPTIHTENLVINYDLLETHLETYQRSFAEAEPCQHLVIDSFLKPEIAKMAFQSFPKMEEMDMLKDFRQFKAQDPNLEKFHPVFQDLIFGHLHSLRFLELLAKITAIPDLMADSKLYAAGLAQGSNGSFLSVHIDNSSHPVYKWYRRLNLLIYLNQNWTKEKGGHLELWNSDMSESISILPIFNRMVIFATDKQSWHGYRKVHTPRGDTRKSINIYYFTEQSPDSTNYYHITSFRARRNEMLHKVLYPADNLVRRVVRYLRPKKDKHAVLFDRENASK